MRPGTQGSHLANASTTHIRVVGDEAESPDTYLKGTAAQIDISSLRKSVGLLSKISEGESVQG